MNDRIVHSVASLAEVSGGPSRAIPALAAAVARAGGDVRLVTGDDGRPAVPTDVVTQRVPAPGWRSYCRTVRTALGDHGILHDHGIWSAANRAAMAAARGRPYVISPHGMLEPWAMAHHHVRKQLAWAVYQRQALAGAAALVATAEPERATIRARFPGLPVALIPNGVAVPEALPQRRPGAPRTLLFLSRLHPVKNLPGLIDAWAILIADPRFDDWQLRIVGPDEAGHAAVVRAKAAALGHGGRIAIEGAAGEADKAVQFAAAELFVLPSFTENFGIVAAEALAHGVPVVASTGTPWSGLAAHGCGWQAGTDPTALAAVLGEAMLLPPAALAERGAKGRAWMARDFAWDAIGARMLGVYTWLLHGGARPDCVDV